MKELTKKPKFKTILDYILLSITFCLLLFFGIKNKQKIIKLVPTLVSLVVFMLASRANRFNYLLGALNSIVYSIGFFMEGLYAGAFSALVFSFGLQMITFIRWNKRSYKQATVFRKMKWWQEILLIVGMFSLWGILAIVLNLLPGAKLVVSDTFGFVMGNGAMFLTIFAFIEAMPFSFLNLGNSFVLWISTIIAGNTANITYVISNSFSLYCTIWMYINWIKIYKEQQKLKKSVEKEKEICKSEE